MTQKECIKCNIVQDIESFSNSKSSKDGKYSYCKSCSRQMCKKYYNENLEYYKKYRDENLEYHKEYSKKYYNENKEVILARIKKYHDENKELINEKMKKERYGLYATELVKIKDKSCEYCGMTNDEHLKKWNERLHTYRPSKEDKQNKAPDLNVNNDIPNLQTFCRSCRLKKGHEIAKDSKIKKKSSK